MENRMAITEQDKELLTKFIKEKNIKSVLEFGTGESTFLFNVYCTRVISFDTDKDYSAKFRSKLNCTALQLWEGKLDADMQDTCSELDVDMVFIDGPAGGENREPSYRLAVMTKAKYIACHDTHRETDYRWVSKHLKDWTLVTSNSMLSIYENKPCTSKVFISIPMPRDYKVDFETMRFCTTSMRKGWHWANCPSIEPTLARNMLIAQFLTREEFADYTHLFFLDADTIPPPDTIQKLLYHDKDVVAGVTPIWLHSNIYWNVQVEEKKNMAARALPKKLTKVLRVGGTTVLIKRKVLEKLAFPFYKVVLAETMEEINRVGPILQGSDYYFCDRVREAGFEIYIDPQIMCKHIRPVNLLDLIVEYKE